MIEPRQVRRYQLRDFLAAVSSRSPSSFAVAAILAMSLASGCTPLYGVEDRQCVLYSYEGHLLIGFRQTRTPLENCDARTLDVLASDSYAKDASHVWYRGVPVRGADAASFDVLQGERVWSYGRDQAHVYFQAHPIPRADPTSFRLLKTPYSRDARHAFCGNVPLEGADPGRFEVLVSESVALGTPRPVDEAARSRVLEQAGDDPQMRRLWELAFEADMGLLRGSGWARDQHFYYRGCLHMESIDYASFEILPGGWYSKDRSSVYYDRREVPGADPATFEVVDEGQRAEARDATRDYRFGRPVTRR